MYDMNVYPQVVRAYRMILRHIRAARMQAGDLVDSQPDLRQILNYSNITLSRAMECLVNDGVLERRKRAGTIVLDLSKARLTEHTVALAMVPHTTLPNEPYYGHLLRALEGYVREILGAQIRIVVHHLGSRQYPAWPLSTFPGLDEMVLNAEVDAVICPIGVRVKDVTHLAQMGVPWLHVGSDEESPSGVVIDQEPMIQRACRMLVERGSCRIGLILRKVSSFHSVDKLRFFHAYHAASQEHGFKTMPLIESEDISLEDGRQVARQLLKLPTRQRPEGLIVINDMLAAGLTDVLRDTPAYRPHIAVQANTPGSLIFGVPVIRFDVDIYQLAQQVVSLLQQSWQQPSEGLQCRWIVPYLAHEQARDMQIPAMAMAD